MTQDFSSLAFKLDISDADKKIRTLSSRLGTLQSNAEKAAKNVSLILADAFSIKDVDATPVANKITDDFENANKKLKEIQAAMKYTQQVAEDVSKAISKHGTANELEKDMARLREVSQLTKTMYDEIEQAKKESTETSFVGMIDLKPIETLRSAVSDLMEHINKAAGAITTHPDRDKNTFSLTAKDVDATIAKLGEYSKMLRIAQQASSIKIAFDQPVRWEELIGEKNWEELSNKIGSISREFDYFLRSVKQLEWPDDFKSNIKPLEQLFTDLAKVNQSITKDGKVPAELWEDVSKRIIEAVKQASTHIETLGKGQRGFGKYHQEIAEQLSLMPQGIAQVSNAAKMYKSITEDLKGVDPKKIFIDADTNRQMQQVGVNLLGIADLLKEAQGQMEKVKIEVSEFSFPKIEPQELFTKAGGGEIKEKLKTIDDFADLATKAKEITIATEEVMQAIEDLKDTDTQGLLGNIRRALEKAIMPVYVKMDFAGGQEDVEKLGSQINEVVTKQLQPIVDQMSVSVPIGVGDLKIDQEKVKEQFANLKQAIEGVIQANEKVVATGLELPPIAFKPPTTEDMDAGLQAVRDYVAQKNNLITLPRPTMLPPTKENISKVMVETRKAFRAEHVRMTNLLVEGPSKKQMLAAVQRAREFMRENTVRMKIAGFDGSEQLSLALDELSVIASNFKDTIDVPKIPDEVLKSLEDYRNQLEVIAKAITVIEENNRKRVVSANVIADQGEKSQLKNLKEIFKAKDDNRKSIEAEVDGVRETLKLNVENAKAMLEQNKHLQYLNSERGAQLSALDKLTKSAVKESDQVSDNAIARIRSDERMMKNQITMRDNQRVITETLSDTTRVADSASKSIAQIALNPKQLSDPLHELKVGIKQTDSAMVNIAKSAGLVVSGRAVIGHFREATRRATQFGIELHKIISLEENFSFDRLSKGLMELDARLGNAIHNARTLYWAYSSGVRGTERELVRFTETMAKTALTISANVIPTMDAATSLMNAFGLKAKDATDVADLLFKIVKEGKSHGAELASSIGHVVASAASLGLTMDELGAATATLTRTIRTSRALTYLNNILGKMISPTENVRKAAERMGLDFSMAAIRTKGFAQVMREVRHATQGNAQAIAELFPDLRSQRAAITLLGTQYEEFEKQLTIFSQKAGSMEQAYSIIADTPEKHFEALKNALAIIGIEAGRTAISFATLGGALQPVISRFNKLDADGKKVVGRMTASVGVMGSMMIAQKGLAMAQYASAQAAIQNNMLELESARIRTDATEAIQKQLLEVQQLTLARKQEKLAAAMSDDELKRIDSLLQELEIRKSTYKATNAQIAAEKDMAGVRSEMGLKTDRELAALRKDALADYKLLISQTKQGEEAMNVKLDETLRLEIQERVNLRRKEVDLILQAHKLQSREGIREDVIYAGSLKVEAYNLRNQAEAERDEQERARLFQEVEQREALAKQVLEMAKGYHIMNENAQETLQFEQSISQYVENIKHQQEQISKEGGKRIGQSQVMLELMRQEAEVQQRTLDRDVNMAALRDDVANSYRRAGLLVQSADLKNEMAEMQIKSAGLELEKEVRMRELGVKNAQQEIDYIKTKVQEMQKEAQIFATNNKHLLANSELEIKNASVRSGRRGAIVAEAKANEVLAQSEKQLLHMQERINEVFLEKGNTVTAEQVKELEAIESQIEALREKNRQLQKGNELTLIGVGKSLAVGKKGLEAGIDGKDIGRIAGMLAGRTIAAYIGPGAAVISMLPMGKVMNTLKSAIGTATASLVLWNKATRAHTIGTNLDKAATLSQTKAALSSSVATLLASGAEKELAATRAAGALAAASAMGIIGVAAAGLFALLSKTKHGGPMRGVAEQLVGLETLKESLENEELSIQYYEQRKQTFAEISNTSKAVLSNISAEVAALKQQKAELEKAGSSQEEINKILERLAILAQQQSDILASENYLKTMQSVMNRTSGAVKALAMHQEVLDKEGTLVKRAIPVDSWQEYGQMLIPLWNLYKSWDLGKRTVDRLLHGGKRAKQAADGIERVLAEQEANHRKLQEGTNLFFSAQSVYMQQNIDRIRQAALLDYKTAQQQSDIYRQQMLESAKQLPDQKAREKHLADLSKRAQEALNTFHEAQKDHMAAVLDKDEERIEMAEKHADESKAAYDKAHEDLEKYQQKVSDQADKYFRDFNQWLNSLPKAITDTLNEELGEANYQALWSGETGKINAIQKAIVASQQKQKEYASDLSKFAAEHLSHEEAVDAQQKAILDMKKIERDQTIALHQLYTQILDNINKINDDVAKKMSDITKAQWDRAIANPLSMFSQGQINKWASSGQGVLATIIKVRSEQLKADLEREQEGYSKLLKDIETYQAEGQVDLQVKATQELMDSYNRQVGITNEATEAQRRLADAEAQANKEAYDLATSINRLFKETTQQAVRADSSEALRLMSRDFVTPSQLDVQDTQQERLRGLVQENEMRQKDMLEEMSRYLTDARTKAEAMTQKQFDSTTTFEKATNTFNKGVDIFRSAIRNLPNVGAGAPQTVNATPANR